MRKLTTTLLSLAILLTPAVASAEQPKQADPSAFFILEVKSLDTQSIIVTEKPLEQVQPPKPDPVVYKVIEGDNLTKIGTAHNVKWQRLWYKNKQIKNPDVIHIGDKITIPLAGEKLKTRSMPAVVRLPKATPGVSTSINADYSGGNTYTYGYCTWYVKNRRGASLPNGLGNANTWYSIARAMGLAVGSTPRAGAVGTTTAGAEGHVVYVERVNKNGSVYISEMNYEGWGVKSYRITSASEFLYIY